MAFRYLIDGYNLLYALPDLPPGSLQEKRHQLLAFLLQRRPQGKNPVTIVFDSRAGLGEQSQQDDITVIFTAGETADDYISALVRKTANPRTLVVVSNDQGIRHMVRGTGARFLSCMDFLKAAKNPPANKTDFPKPSSDQAQEITEEFRKKWL